MKAINRWINKHSVQTSVIAFIIVFAVSASIISLAVSKYFMTRFVVNGYLTDYLQAVYSDFENNFNLADDLIEPYRPLVDLYVAGNVEPTGELTPKRKQQLFNLTTYLVKQGQRKYRLMTGVGRCCASLSSCISEQSKDLELPQLIALEQRCDE